METFSWLRNEAHNIDLDSVDDTNHAPAFRGLKVKTYSAILFNHKFQFRLHSSETNTSKGHDCLVMAKLSARNRQWTFRSCQKKRKGKKIDSKFSRWSLFKLMINGSLLKLHCTQLHAISFIKCFVRFSLTPPVTPSYSIFIDQTIEELKVDVRTINVRFKISFDNFLCRVSVKFSQAKSEQSRITIYLWSHLNCGIELCRYF